MSIHSMFLIHWTGWEFCSKDSGLTREIRTKFVDRLRDNCEHGLYMKQGGETIHGVDSSQVHPNISRVCFSEVRLSQAAKQAEKFGMLGIGVHRDFVIKRGGNPVLYVRNGDTDTVVQNIAFVHSKLVGMAKGDDKKTERQMLDALRYAMGFLKNMSERKNDLDFALYEEMEWRIVHSNTFAEYFTEEDATQHIYRVPIQPQDIRMLIFPDHETRKMAVEDAGIKDFFKDGFPMVTTIKECGSF
jgi:hypothetical protein